MFTNGPLGLGYYLDVPAMLPASEEAAKEAASSGLPQEEDEGLASAKQQDEQPKTGDQSPPSELAVNDDKKVASLAALTALASAAAGSGDAVAKAKVASDVRRTKEGLVAPILRRELELKLEDLQEGVLHLVEHLVDGGRSEVHRNRHLGHDGRTLHARALQLDGGQRREAHLGEVFCSVWVLLGPALCLAVILF